MNQQKTVESRVLSILKDCPRARFDDILGYDRVGKEMVINPEQAKTVRMIYDMYLSGMGVTTIQYELEKAGRLTALGKEQWFASYISKMLRNSFYCGIITYHKEYTPDFLLSLIHI